MKEKLSIMLIAALMLASAVLGAASGIQIHTHSAPYENSNETTVQAVPASAETSSETKETIHGYALKYATYSDVLLDGYTGYVIVGRATCPYCSIVFDYLSSVGNFDVPVMYISLETAYKGPDYDLIKEKLNTKYVPYFIYYEDGVQERVMNCPLDTKYTDNDTDFEIKKQMRSEMEDRINRFFNGEEVYIPVEE